MRWVLITVLFFPATSHAQPTPTDLLRTVKETYAGANQYQFVTRLVERKSGVETTGSDETAVDKRGRVWFKAVGTAAIAWSGGREGEIFDYRGRWSTGVGLSLAGCGKTPETSYGEGVLSV
jgi:hypothetical protein